MVVRLVEEQQVGLGEQRLREQHAQAEAARQLAHRTLVPRVRDAEARKQRSRLRLGLVATEAGKVALEHGEALPCRRVGSLGTREQPLSLLERGPQLRAPAHDDIEHALVVVAEVVLPERADAQPTEARDVACRRLQLTGHHPQQRRLPGPVRADEAVVPVRPQLPRDALVQGLPAEAHGDVGQRDHVMSFLAARTVIARPFEDAAARAGHATRRQGDAPTEQVYALAMTVDPLVGWMFIAMGTLNLMFGVALWLRPSLLFTLDPIVRWFARNRTDEQRRRGSRAHAVLWILTGVFFLTWGVWSVLSE